MPRMISNSAGFGRCPAGACEPQARSTLAFAAIGDHARLPWRFFARLFASDGWLVRR
jgi:hypothetical protein